MTRTEFNAMNDARTDRMLRDCGLPYDDGPYGVLYCTREPDHEGPCCDEEMNRLVHEYLEREAGEDDDASHDQR